MVGIQNVLMVGIQNVLMVLDMELLKLLDHLVYGRVWRDEVKYG